MNQSKTALAKKLLPFESKEKEHVFWHDLKKSFTINNFQLENIQTEVFGGISNELKEAILDLQKHNILALLNIENLRIAQKIEDSIIKFQPQENITLQEFLEQNSGFIKPFLTELKIEFKENSFTIKFDPSLLKIILWNIIVFSSVGLSKEAILEIKTLEENELVFKLKNYNSLIDIKKLLSEELLYKPHEEEYLKYSSLILTIKLIVEVFGKNFNIFTKENGLTLEINF